MTNQRKRSPLLSPQQTTTGQEKQRAPAASAPCNHMTRRHQMARRAVLKSALGGVLLAPFMRSRVLQAQNASPKRIVLVFTPDSHPPEWWPTGSGSNFVLQEPLADFSGLESDMLFVRRLDHSWSFDNHHEAGIVQLFTGARFQDDTSRYASGPSIDQYLLQNTELRGATPRASVHLAVDDGRTDKRHVISYSGAAQPIQNEVDPGRAFRTLFDGVSFGDTSTAPPPDANAGPSLQQQIDQRVTEVSVEELRYMQRFLGQEERERLELHVESLRELQLQLEAQTVPAGAGGAAAVGGACEEVNTQGFSNRLNNAETMTAWAKMNAELLVNSFTCDIARAGVYQFSFSGGHHEGLLNFQKSWHDDVAHVSRTDDSVSVGGENMTTRRAFQAFDRFWSGQVAYLASRLAYLTQRLASIAEGDGTMLDNTLIYWGVESGTNHSHDPNDMQYLLIGGRNMGFQLGQFLDVGRQSAHRLHVSVLHAFGLEEETFGPADDGSGPLPGVLA